MQRHRRERPTSQDPVAVLGEAGGKPDHDLNAEPSKPAENQVLVDPLDQLLFRMDPVKCLQRQIVHQLFREFDSRPIGEYSLLHAKLI